MQLNFRNDILRQAFNKKKLDLPVLYGYENIYTSGIPIVPLKIDKACSYQSLAGPKFQVNNEFVIVAIKGVSLAPPPPFPDGVPEASKTKSKSKEEEQIKGVRVRQE